MVKKYFPLLVLFTISSLYLYPFFHKGIFLTHDGENHIARIGAYYKAFANGQLPPRWAGDLNYGFGTPAFIFFYPLSGYVGSLLHAFGFTLTDTFKLLLAISFLAAPLTFYLWISRIVKPQTAFVSSLLYGLSSYHFLDMYVRGDIGELFAFVFIPLVFFSLQNLKSQKKTNIVLGAFSYAFLVLSHNILSLLFSAVFFGYIVFLNPKKNWVSAFAMLVFGLLLSAFFWMPALFESKFINHAAFTEYYKSQFPYFLQLFYSNWGFGTNVRGNGGLFPGLGIVLTVLVFTSIFTMFKKRKQPFLFWIFVFFFSLFMTTPFSIPVWDHIPLLPQMQFPWRFMAVASFSAVVLVAYFLDRLNSKKINILVILLFLFSSIPLIKTNTYVVKPDLYYLLFSGSTSYHGEATTIWTSGDASQFAKSPIEIIDGNGSIKNLMRKSNTHSFVVDAKTDVSILDNTLYFPGWTAQVDGKKTAIEFQDMNHRGLITFAVPKGTHTVKVLFNESRFRFFADVLSLSVIPLLLLFLYSSKLFR